MITFLSSLLPLKGDIVLMDADVKVVQRIMAMQYNLETPTLHKTGAGSYGELCK